MATKATELGQLARLLTIDSNGVTISGTLSATTLSGNGAGLTGVTSYTDSDFFGDLVLDSARTIVRGYFSAGGDAAYDSATGRITVNVPEGYTDSDTLSYLTTNTYATQSYVTGAVNAVIDAAPGAMDTLNELAAALNDDPNAFNTLQTLINANLDSADAVLLIDSDYVRQRAAKFVHDTYRFTATSGQTTFSGSDTASKTLDYTQSNLFVQLNGVNLVDNADFTATNGTSIVLDQGADSGDDLVITAFNHFDTTFAQAFEYTHRFVATTGQTDFSGSDVDGNVLIFNAQGTIVSLNGLTLQPTVDYTASNGTNVVLVTSADSADELLVRSFAKLEVADTVSATNGGTFGNNITVNGNIIVTGTVDGIDVAATATTANAALPKAGGTMTGVIAGFTSTGIDDNATSTAITLDASGNLLVGKSSNAFGTTGVTLNPDGSNNMTRASDPPLALNRLTSDGTILNLYKDGSTVGSIGTEGGYTKIIGGNGSVGSGLGFFNLAVNPRNAAGSLADGTISLGEGSNRFKDLYLSGGVYLGGTGSANHLDDYEESVFVLTVNQGGISIDTNYDEAFYTKVGRSVTVSGLVLATSSGDSNVLKINLPFVAATRSANQTDYFIGSVMSYNVPTGTGGLVPYIAVNTDKLVFQKTADNGVWSSIVGTQLASGDHFYFTITYQTN